MNRVDSLHRDIIDFSLAKLYHFNKNYLSGHIADRWKNANSANSPGLAAFQPCSSSTRATKSDIFTW